MKKFTLIALGGVLKMRAAVTIAILALGSHAFAQVAVVSIKDPAKIEIAVRLSQVLTHEIVAKEVVFGPLKISALRLVCRQYDGRLDDGTTAQVDYNVVFTDGTSLQLTDPVVLTNCPSLIAQLKK